MPRRRNEPGATVARGYGADHKRTRRYWEPIVAAGNAYCCEDRCINPGGRWIAPGEPWHLAHEIDRKGYKGPAHKACNLSEAGTRGNKMRAKPETVDRPREWRPTQDW